MATEKETGLYLDDMLSLVGKYLENRLASLVARAALLCFFSGNRSTLE